MSNRVVMQHALNSLSKRVGLDSLELNDKDECYLVFDDKYHVRCSYIEKADECILYSIVGRVSKYHLNAYTKILADNFFWVGTAGSTLALEELDDEDDELVLKEHIPMPVLDDQILYERVEDFVNAVEYWTTEYPKLETEEEVETVKSSKKEEEINNMDPKVKVKECNIM